MSVIELVQPELRLRGKRRGLRLKSTRGSGGHLPVTSQHALRLERPLRHWASWLHGDYSAGFTKPEPEPDNLAIHRSKGHVASVFVVEHS